MNKQKNINRTIEPRADNWRHVTMCPWSYHMSMHTCYQQMSIGGTRWQEAKLSLRVTEYFTKSFKITQRSFEVTLLSGACTRDGNGTEPEPKEPN